MSEQRLTELIRTAAGIAVQPRIERVSNFRFAAQIADRYRDHRCFLVGDAAHRMTPRGGTGMNTAIHHWLHQDGATLSTLDLLGEGLTLLSGPDEPGSRRAWQLNSAAPLTIHTLAVRRGSTVRVRQRA